MLVTIDVTDAIQSKMPNATVQTFGSFPCGLSTFLSDLDFSIIQPLPNKDEIMNINNNNSSNQNNHIVNLPMNNNSNSNSSISFQEPISNTHENSASILTSNQLFLNPNDLLKSQSIYHIYHDYYEHVHNNINNNHHHHHRQISLNNNNTDTINENEYQDRENLGGDVSVTSVVSIASDEGVYLSKDAQEDSLSSHSEESLSKYTKHCSNMSSSKINTGNGNKNNIFEIIHQYVIILLLMS